MIYIQPLSNQEITELEKLTQQAVGRIAERTWYVLFSNKGKSVPQICEIFNRHPNCVRKWLKRYQTQGINGLFDKPRAGRPSRINEQIKKNRY